MKVALIADTHFGVRNDSEVFLNNQERFLREAFFTIIDELQITRLIHLGDLVDRRKSISYKTANFIRNNFVEPLANRNIKTDIICGNHDASFKNTNEVNALRELVGDRYPEVFVQDRAKVIPLNGSNAVVVPWICDENRVQTMEMLATAPADYALGHFELAGFKMYAGMPVAKHGLSANVLGRFKHVYSGHFHEPSSQDNVTYLGAMSEHTWADAGCHRGFGILDTVTQELARIANPFPVYETVTWDETPQYRTDEWAGKIVRVHVKSRTNSAKFDSWIKKLEDAGAADVEVIEPPVKVEITAQLPVDNGDVLEILSAACQELAVDRTALMALLSDIHREAIEKRTK